MTFAEAIGFFGLGLLVGAVLVDVRYRYRAVIAARLSGQSQDKTASWFDGIEKDFRGWALVVIILFFGVSLVIYIATNAYIHISEQEIKAAEKNIILEQTTGNQSWVWRNTTTEKR